MRSFSRDQRGSVAIILGLLMLPMIVALGAATDIARFEILRVRMQNALDRGVLAAAAINQTQPTRQTLEDYVGANLLDMGAELDFEESFDGIIRRVQAEASYSMQTAFLGLVGIDEMDMSVAATAEQGIKNLEISLVLDYSWSMDDDGKLQAMKDAAIGFLYTMMPPERRDRVTVNLIPYSGQVSVGRDAFRYLRGSVDHPYSYCMKFPVSVYGNGVPDFRRTGQVSDFRPYNHGWPDYKWCPLGDQNNLVPLSNDPHFMDRRIRGAQTQSGTGTQIGMKWATILLDPAMRRYTGALGQPDRPADYADPNTVKVVVLMTDGAVTLQRAQNCGFEYENNRWRYRCTSSDYDIRTALDASEDMSAECAAARNNGIIIYTIAFQVADANRDEMRDCASTPDQFYDVDDLDINSAFQSIARSLENIRLIE